MSAIENILSKLFNVDVAAINDGHGLGCPCPKHMAERDAALRKIMKDGPEPGTIGEALEKEISASVGRRILARES